MSGSIYKAKIQQVTARAPATLTNLAMGFDLIGVAIKQPADQVILTKRQDSRLKIVEIASSDSLPYQVTRNTATIALRSLLKKQNDKQGFDLVIKKGIDCGSGMGGSAASSVAALVAYNGFLKKPLSPLVLLQHAITAEKAVSGGECIENPAAALWGGVVLCPNKRHILPLVSPQGALLVVKPKIEVKTKEARALLPEMVTLSACTERAGRCAAWVQAIGQRQWDLASTMMEDNIIEPARAALWPHYPIIKKVGKQAGARAVCISGSGPTVLLWIKRSEIKSMQSVIERCCIKAGYPVRCWASSWREDGAQVIGVQ